MPRGETGRILTALGALAALAVGLGVGFGAARALPAGHALRGGERGVSSSDGTGGARRGGIARSGASGGRASVADRTGGGAREGSDGLGDDVAAIVLEEVRAAVAATSTAGGASTANPGERRVSGHVRAVDGAPVAGVTIEARRLHEPEPAPSEEEARRVALLGRGGEAGRDPLDALMHDVRIAARDLVRRRAMAPLAVTGADGAYAIAGLAPGRYTLRAEAEGWVVRSRRAEGIPGAPATEPEVTLGGAGGSSVDLVRDWTAERVARVRFEGEGPGGAAPLELAVEVRGAGYWRARPGSHEALTLPPGLHVAEARGEFAGAGPDAPDRTLGTIEPFVVSPGRDPVTVLLRFRERSRVLLRVESDDPETEAWHRVRVVVRPASDGGAGVAWDRLADGTRGLDVRAGYESSGDVRAAELPPLPPGLYVAEAYRRLEPAEEPGPRATLEVRETGDSEATVRLPPSGRAVRITVRVEGFPPDSTRAVIELRRRARGAFVSLAKAFVESDGDGPPSARFALRSVDVVDQGGAPADLVARAITSGSVFRAEVPVPRGRDVTVVLRLPEAAHLALEVDPGGHVGPPGDLLATLCAPDGEELIESALDARGGGRRLTARFEPVGAGTYLVRVGPRPDEGALSPALAAARVTLAPGENSLSITLAETAASSILPSRDGMLRIVAASSDAATGAGILHEAEVEAGIPAPLPPLPPGRYVALLEGARDPFGESGVPRERAAMAFRLPGAGRVIPFAPEAVDGWAPRLVSTWSAHAEAGLRQGDVLVTIDGAAPADLWEPLAPLLDAPPREPDLARVTLLRDGAPVTIDLSLALIRASGARSVFAPVPAER